MLRVEIHSSFLPRKGLNLRSSTPFTLAQKLRRMNMQTDEQLDGLGIQWCTHFKTIRFKTIAEARPSKPATVVYPF